MVSFKMWMFLSCTGSQWNMNCQRTEDQIYCKLGPSNPFWSFCGKSASSQIRINKKLLGGGVHLRKNWEPYLQATESLWGHFFLLPVEKFFWLLLLFLHSEWFAVMNKCYRMAYDFFSRTCPCHIQEISQVLFALPPSLLYFLCQQTCLLMHWEEDAGERKPPDLYIDLEGLPMKKKNKEKKKAIAVNIVKMTQNAYFNSVN